MEKNIERIKNGFIVSNIDGSNKCFYKTIFDFYAEEVLPDIEKSDKYFREHDTYGETMRASFEIEFTPEKDSIED